MQRVSQQQRKTLSRNLRRLREQAGLTQEQLAEKADITPRSLQFIEAGQIRSVARRPHPPPPRPRLPVGYAARRDLKKIATRSPKARFIRIEAGTPNSEIDVIYERLYFG